MTEGVDAIAPPSAGALPPSVTNIRHPFPAVVLVPLGMEATSSLSVTHISDEESGHRVALAFFFEQWAVDEAHHYGARTVPSFTGGPSGLLLR